jgi:hypothetical protein
MYAIILEITFLLSLIGIEEKYSGKGHKHPDKKPSNNELIIQTYNICFILMVILKDILKN